VCLCVYNHTILLFSLDSVGFLCCFRIEARSQVQEIQAADLKSAGNNVSPSSWILSFDFQHSAESASINRKHALLSNIDREITV
jgi:hypothetical protein